MNVDEHLKVTPSKGTRPGSTSSPSTRGSGKKATKNAKITNFFTKVNSPLNKNNSNSNQTAEQSENQQIDDLSKDASSSSMKAPCTDEIANGNGKVSKIANKEYVFIVPTSDDDTNASTTKGSQAASKRKRPPSVHSNNSKSSDGFILTTNNNNELGLARKRRILDQQQQHEGVTVRGGSDSSSNQEVPSTPTTNTRSSGRDSRSRDSLPESISKRLKVEHSQLSNQSSGQHSGKLVTRIQPTMISCRTKMVDFQSVPSDLNLPRDQAQKLIEKLFLVKMPEDFYLFWEFAKTINHRKPCSAFSHAQLEWNLVGPFDVLSGLITDFHGFSKESLLRHCRFYYDPPEFQTVIVKKDEPFTHYGYYRDEPQQNKPIVAMNKANLGGQLHEAGDNLFTLLRCELESAIGCLSKSSQDIATEPTFLSSSSRNPRSASDNTTPTKAPPPNGSTPEMILPGTPTNHKQTQLERAKVKQELTIIRDKLLDFCANHENISSESWSRTRTRRAKRCAKTLNTIGIVVPIDGDIGYRNLGVNDVKLRTMLARISEYKDDKSKCGLYKELHQIINNTNMANDECDFGMGLELGLDLFYTGDQFFHKDVDFLLSNAYTLLGRSEFCDILKAHLEERRSSNKVSLLD